MSEAKVTLIKGDKISVETDYRDALPQNMYAIERTVLGATGYMRQYSGLVKLTDGVGADRGGVYNERFAEHYRISGEKFISVSANGVVTEIGDVPGVSQARLKDFYSFNTQGVIANNRFFLYSPLAGLNEVIDPDFVKAIDGVWIDGYYVMTDGEYLFHTEIADETAINPLDYATAEFMPDPSLGLSKTQDDKLMVWGRYSLEYFVNIANDNFAFTRLGARAQKIGIVATHAKCEMQGSFYITGGFRDSEVSIYTITLGKTTRIATKEIDKILSKYKESELSNMRMESLTENGTSFSLIHLPEETLCFNATIAFKFGFEVAWSILKSGVVKESNYRAINGVFDARSVNWVYGDKRSGVIGILDEVSTHYGEVAEWILYTPFINLETKSIDKIELETIPGHTEEIEAKLSFSMTHDGLTYSAEHWALYGEPGEYGQRYIRRRLGYCRNWVGFKFRGASTSKMAFAAMKITYS